MNPNPYTFQQLHADRLARATKPFNARGIKLKRCNRCFVSAEHCICAWRPVVSSQVDVILLMHSDEILKPTNTGRLISDIMPNQCYVFEWARTQPNPNLMALLNDPERLCLLVYPSEDNVVSSPLQDLPTAQITGKTLTLVVLDGTWRQSRKMVNNSDYLQKLTALKLNFEQVAQYSMRKAPEPDQLSTCEAVAIAFAQCQAVNLAKVLNAYFEVFNQHYHAGRMNRVINESDTHRYLASLKA